MTYGTILASAPVLQKLVGQPLPLRQAYQLTKIVRKINEELGFFQEKQKEINNKETDSEAKIKMMTELLNFEVEWELEPLELDVSSDIVLSASDLDASEGIITIK